MNGEDIKVEQNIIHKRETELRKEIKSRKEKGEEGLYIKRGVIYKKETDKSMDEVAARVPEGPGSGSSEPKKVNSNVLKANVNMLKSVNTLKSLFTNA